MLRKRLFMKDQQMEEDLSDLNVSEHEMLSILCDRIYSLKVLLQEKSDNMVKLQADYELLKVFIDNHIPMLVYNRIYKGICIY